MQTHRIVTFFITSWLLLGCQNLNVATVTVTRMEYNHNRTVLKEEAAEMDLVSARPELPYHFDSRTPVPAEAVAPEPKASEPKVVSSAVLCPMFHAPVFPPPPPLPIKELEQIGANPARVDELQRRHIEELRVYIFRHRDAMIRSYARYLADCRAFTRKQR